MSSRDEVAREERGPVRPVLSRNAAKVLPLTSSEIDRFIKHLEIEIKPDGSIGCWTWTGWREKDGYGMMRFRGISVMVHHVTFTVPPGLVRDHICNNRACANPAHIRAVTQYENVMRGKQSMAYIHRNQTHCCRGHEFSEDNTGWRLQRGRRTRVCKACVKLQIERDRLRRIARRQEQANG